MSISVENKSTRDSLSVPIFAALTFMLIASLPISSMSVLFKEISGDLNLGAVQIGFVWGMTSLGSIFITPLGGVLCDRFGTRRTIMVLSLLAGSFIVLMGLSGAFLSLMVTTFLWGMCSSSIVPAINMIASQYSARQRQGLAQGIVATGGGLGLTIGSLIAATLLSPLLGGWRHVLFLYGGIAITVSLLWQFGVKGDKKVKPAGIAESVTFRKAFAHLLRLKPLWLIGLSMLTYVGCVTGMQGYLPYYLENNGWTVVAASGSLGAYMAAATIGAIPLSILSDRIGSRKIILIASYLAAIIGIGLLSIVHNGILLVLVIIAGTFAGTSAALFTTVCIETKDVGMIYSGTAVGFALAIGGIGKAFSPPLGNSLANSSTVVAWPFVFWASLAAVGVIIFSFVKETGSRNKGKRTLKS